MFFGWVTSPRIRFVGNSILFPSNPLGKGMEENRESSDGLRKNDGTEKFPFKW
jgi:hypothetical protein